MQTKVDVYAEREQLIKKASELLEAEDTSIIMTMDQMLKDEELIREKIMVPQFAPDEVIPEDAAKEVERMHLSAAILLCRGGCCQ